MTRVNQPTPCANCASLLDHPTVVVDGQPYCCSGCVKGGPCICAGLPDDAPNTRQLLDSSPVAFDPDSPYSRAFAQMVNNLLREVEVTRQAIQTPQGPVKELLELLQRTARLLQITTYRLEEQRQPGTPDWVSRIQTEVQAKQPEEQVRLYVEGVHGPDAVFCYTRALSKLPSVQGMKLVNVNGADVCYQVQTISKAKLARDVMSLPGYPPLRIHSTTDEITVLLSERVTDRDTIDPTAGVPNATVETPGEGSLHPRPARTARRASSRGMMEVGIDGFFNARHYLVKDGEPGPVETKSWRVEISLEGERAAESGQLEGLEPAQRAVQGLLAGYNNKLLNKMPPFDEIQPTPENITRTLYDQISVAIAEQGLGVKGLKVWVSPTQYVWYMEPPDDEE